MDITIVIPAYNEAKRIETALTRVSEYFQNGALEWEVVVADDGSGDGTAGVVQSWKERNQGVAERVRLLRLSHQGKGGAVAAAVLAAEGKWVLMSDADLSTPLSEWEKLKTALMEGAVIAAGSRQAAGAEIGIHQPWFRQTLGLLFGRLVRRMFAVGVIDSQCGFKGFQAEAVRAIFQELITRGFCFDVEILARARMRGLKVVEVPVRWNNHPDSKVRVWRDWPEVAGELWRLKLALRREQKARTGGR